MCGAKPFLRTMDRRTHIIGLEAVLLDAMRASDVATLDGLLADDLLFTDHVGRSVTKEADLAAHRSGALRIVRLTASEQRIAVQGDAVFVSVRVALAGSYLDTPFEGDLRFTRCWMERAGGWQVVVAHSSAVV